MTNNEIPRLYNPEEIANVVHGHMQMIRSARTRLLVQTLGMEMKAFPLVDEGTSESILCELDDAQEGFRLTFRMDTQGEDINKKFLEATNANPTLDDVWTFMNSFQQLALEDTSHYISAYVRAVIQLAYLSHSTNVSFKQLDIPMDNNLGRVENARSYWDVSISPESLWLQLQKLKDWSTDVLYNSQPQPGKNSLQ